MSADLPDSHASGHAMARVLVTYLDDERVVRSAILSNFARSPSLGEIKLMRYQFLHRKRPIDAPFKAHEGYYAGDASEKAARTSARFLAALDAERAISRGFVNPAWRRVGHG